MVTQHLSSINEDRPSFWNRESNRFVILITCWYFFDSGSGWNRKDYPLLVSKTPRDVGEPVPLIDQCTWYKCVSTRKSYILSLKIPLVGLTLRSSLTKMTVGGKTISLLEISKHLSKVTPDWVSVEGSLLLIKEGRKDVNRRRTTKPQTGLSLIISARSFTAVEHLTYIGWNKRQSTLPSLQAMVLDCVALTMEYENRRGITVRNLPSFCSDLYPQPMS